MTTFYGWYAPVTGTIAYVPGPIPTMVDSQAIAFDAGAGLVLVYFPPADEEAEWFIGSLGRAVDADFTWEMWIRTTQVPGAPVRLVDQASGGVFPYRLELLPAGTLRTSRSDGTLTTTVDSIEVVNDDTWHYVTAYKAGAVIGTTVDDAAPATTTDTLVGSTTLTVDGAVAGDGFEGAIAELALYPTALTATQRGRHLAAAAGVPVVA